jgi:peptidyl-prolyl cis-trans isomerase D
MLNLMRKHASSWMIKVVLFAIVVVFVFWGVGSMRSQRATQVADVNGEIVTLEAYRQAYNRLLDNYRRIYGGQLDENMMKTLRPNELALNQIVERILLTQEAERMNIEVAKEELVEAIQRIPAFQNNGVFDYQRYNQVLTQNNLSAERFETDRSQELVLNKLRAVVLNGITVSDDEAQEWYNWSKTKISLEYALFSPNAYKDAQSTAEQDQAYYNEHKDKYRTEAQVKARYLRFDPEAYKADISISDELIAEYYNGNPSEFKTEKRVKARHILFKVDEGADEKTSDSKKAEAVKVYEMAKAGKDFADLAKEYSEGPTKTKGGDLGWFTRERMVKPFADKAFSMAQNDISEPVRTNFGWHIIKVEQVEEGTTQSLKAAAEGIKVKLIDEKAKEVALEKAEALYDSVFDGDDLAAAGQAHQVSMQETEFFTAKGPSQKGILQTRQFAQTAFSLEKMAISEIKDFGNGYYILQVIDRAGAQVPEFDQVADRVKADSIKDQQKKRAQADAEAFLSDVQKGKTFADAGAQYNVTPLETELFERNGAIPKIGNEQQISQAAFELTAQKPLAEKVLQSNKGLYVIRLKDRQVPNAQDPDFDKEKESIVSRLTEQKRQATYQNWLADLKSRSKIDVNKELIRQ